MGRVSNGLKKDLGKLVPYDAYVVAAINLVVALLFIFGWANPKGFTL